MTQTREKLRSELLQAYESLPPVEQTVLQLCSVIFEPVVSSVLYKIFCKADLRLPGEKIGSQNGLELHLKRLRAYKLLNDRNQVPREIIETLTRRAVTAGLIFNAGDLLAGIESEQAWTNKLPTSKHCISCAGPVEGKAFKAAPGPLCPSCAVSELRILSADVNLENWSTRQIMHAVSPEGDIKSRLSILWKVDEALRKFPISNKDSAIFLNLLVQNLGYLQSHPLAFAVRQAALAACTRLGRPILPLLLTIIRKDPWPFYANVLAAVGSIAPEEAEVKDILMEASGDPNPEIRRRVMTILSDAAPSWAVTTVAKLSNDPDKTVSEIARSALFAWTKKQWRPSYSPRAAATAIPGAHLGATIRFGPLVRALQEQLPLVHPQFHSYGDTSCPRMLRDVRIGIYSRDRNFFRKRRDEFISHCGTHPDYFNYFIGIFNDPFDPQWFATLPVEDGMYALCLILNRAMLVLAPDADAFSYALDISRFRSAPRPDTDQLLYHLSSRLIMGGRLSEARKILAEIEEPHFKLGLMGWSLFVEGKNSEAVESFENDIKELRRRVAKRNINFRGMSGFFYVLALIRSRNEELLKKADQLVTSALSSKGEQDFRSSVFRSLKIVIHAQQAELVDGPRNMAAESKAAGILPTLFNAIAVYWVDGRLSEEMTAQVRQIFHAAKEVDMNWVAMESAALLVRSGREDPVCATFLDEVVSRSGMESLVSSIIVEEPWEKGLRALIQIGSEPEGAAGQGPGAGMRLIWLIDYDRGTVSVQPVEQKLTARGTWSKGRTVSKSRLFNRDKVDYICRQDMAVCSALRQDPYFYQQYNFDMDKLLPALVGHPLLFLEKSPFTPVEFVKGEPEIRVAKSGSKLKIEFAAELDKNHVVVVQETPTRFKVIELSEKHRRIARVLGSKGLTVPATATQDVLGAISMLSSHVLVHSDIGGKSKDVVEIEADPRPHVQLVPSGPGIRVEIFVKPFNEEGGPYLKAGVGAANVLAEVGGKKMQTKRDLLAEKAMADAVEAASPALARLADSDRQWLLEDPEDCLQMLLDLKALQEKGQVIVEWPEGERLKVTSEVGFDRFRMKIRGKTDWFEVSGDLTVDDDLVLDMKRLLELLHTTEKRFIPLEDGRFLALTKELRKRLEELDAYAERKGKEIRLHPLAAMTVSDLLESIPNIEVDEAWKTRIERLRAGQEITTRMPSTLRAELRDYQVEGFTWLSRLAHMGIGACLADDMGLGKTVQAIAVILERAVRGPSLVVAPTSVCWNWMSELNRFAPTLNAVQFNGNNRQELAKNLDHHDVLVTSYGLLIQETELLSAIEWNTIVLDEAQAIKNVLTKRSQAAMGLTGNFRLATTGTPIENHLGELWTLFNFINPGLLGSLQRFNARFAVPIEKYNNRDARKRLKRLIQPFMLRRLKSQVLEELPPRTEVVLQVEMSSEETAFYEALRRKALEKIETDSAPVAQRHFRILAEITKLRQAACNPRLVIPDTSLPSAKLEVFGEIVSELLENRHKALVFSQFVGHLNLIREYLDNRKISYRYIDGSTPPKERKQEVEGFQSGEGELFLISLKAGGLGLNLTAADYVIHMDPWWNPAVEDQASDRAYRIGQQRPVTIYRLVTKTTIEEKIVHLHQEKRDLAGSLLDGSDISAKITAEELVGLIKQA
ncbi:MAG: DEAD/DEAH box helicase [Syntrophobacteraceae bacterium]|nr:DEAD/DEAH box helicase [Syntrophobacteraceae bacterium]